MFWQQKSYHCNICFDVSIDQETNTESDVLNIKYDISVWCTTEFNPSPARRASF